MRLQNIFATASFALCLALGSAQASVILDNSPGGPDSISTFGTPDSETYGQVFTAPITGQLSSFTLWLDGGVGALFGGVGDWNGTPTYSPGFGSPNNLYQSADVASAGGGPYTFAPNISVVAGQQYVAYLSVFGVAAANNTTSMPLSVNPVSGIDYFVWNNTSDPRNNASWNYFFETGSVQFSATFDAVPEPGSLALLAFAFVSMLGMSAMRRRAAI